MAIQLFYSYSHKDESSKEELIVHLSSLKNSGVISEWHDRHIVPGQNWKNEIDTHLEAADIVLLLLSADFMASEYCYGIEMKRALDRHRSDQCVVIPVMLRACDMQDAPFMHIQGLPRSMKPVSQWPDRDTAWTEVAKGIREACLLREEVRQSSAELSIPHSFLDKGYSTDRLVPAIYQVAWSPDCRYVATGDNDRQISIWRTDPVSADFESGEFKMAERVDILEKDTHKGVVKALAWDPSGLRLASSGDDKNILIWDLDFDNESKQSPTRRLRRHFESVNSLVWVCPTKLISGSDDSEIMVWDPETGKWLFQFTNCHQRVVCMAISPNKRWLAVGGGDGIVRIFDWRAEKLHKELRGHEGEIYSVAWSSDNTIASASEDKMIRLWNIQESDQSRVLSGHFKEVVSVSFSNDGRLLASQSADMTLRFWNAVEATPIDFFEWECSEHPNVGMRFDIESPLLLSLGKKDHAFRIWQVSTDDLIESAKRRTDKDNQAWNRLESGFISTTLRQSEQHKIAESACVEAGHYPVFMGSQTCLDASGHLDYSGTKEEISKRAVACDFYVGVFHSPADCLFAESELRVFKERGKKIYLFCQTKEEGTTAENISDSFRDKLATSYHIYEYKNDKELSSVVLRVLKDRLSTRRSMIQHSEGGLYNDPDIAA